MKNVTSLYYDWVRVRVTCLFSIFLTTRILHNKALNSIIRLSSVENVSFFFLDRSLEIFVETVEKFYCKCISMSDILDN